MEKKNKVVLKVLAMLREGETYQQMLDQLTEDGMNKEDAQKLLDILTKPVDEDEE